MYGSLYWNSTKKKNKMLINIIKNSMIKGSICLQHTLYDSNHMLLVVVRVSLTEIGTSGLEVKVLFN